jgi:hypothetical protein
MDIEQYARADLVPRRLSSTVLQKGVPNNKMKANTYFSNICTRILSTIFLMIILAGCSKSQVFLVDIETFRFRNSKPNLIKSELEVHSENGYSYYIYKQIDKTLPDSIVKIIGKVRYKNGNIDSLSYFDTSIQLLGVDTFYYKKNPHFICKYLYNYADLIDEEMEIFFVPKHGLVFTKFTPWSGYNTFNNHEPWAEELLVHIFKDTSGFYFSAPILMPNLMNLIENEEVMKILENDSEEWDWEDSTVNK